MTKQEADELWEAVREYCPPEIDKDTFLAGTALLMSLRTPEDAEALAKAIAEARRKP
jgi:hypothetical protein